MDGHRGRYEDPETTGRFEAILRQVVWVEAARSEELERLVRGWKAGASRPTAGARPESRAQPRSVAFDKD
jgi:hypothetical protein